MANGKQLLGQLLYGIRRIPVKFIQRMVDEVTVGTMIGSANIEITPNDAQSWETRTYDTAAIQAMLDAEFLAMEATINIVGVPAMMTDISVVYEKGGGDATSLEAVELVSVSTPFSLGINAGANAEASSYCIPKLKYKLTPFNGENRRVKLCYFYMDTVTIAAALTRLSTALSVTVQAWPAFQEDSVSVILRGERAQASSKANYGASVSAGSGGHLLMSEGTGAGKRIEPSIDPIQLPMSIRAAATPTASDSNTKSASGSYTVTAGSYLSGGAGTPVDAVANGSISPTTIPGTTVTAWPTSPTEYYLYKLTPQPEDAFGRVMVEAVVFNFTW